jgi:septum site-determining protein MinC
VTNAIALQPKVSMRIRARSFTAFVLTPSPPIDEWLAQLDEWSRNSLNFLVAKPIILDLREADLAAPEIGELVASLATRRIRVLALEGAEPDRLNPSLPPLLGDARSADSAVTTAAPAAAAGASPGGQQPSSLLIEGPVRSGQSIVFPDGDVTVLGSVSPGAEIVAGGSIHVYGALRGRAMAGATGNSRARIFCSRNEAEIISVDGYYRTAEQIDASLGTGPTQCWLEDGVLSIVAFD